MPVEPSAREHALLFGVANDEPETSFSSRLILITVMSPTRRQLLPICGGQLGWKALAIAPKHHGGDFGCRRPGPRKANPRIEGPFCTSRAPFRNPTEYTRARFQGRRAGRGTGAHGTVNDLYKIWQKVHLPVLCPPRRTLAQRRKAVKPTIHAMKNAASLNSDDVQKQEF